MASLLVVGAVSKRGGHQQPDLPQSSLQRHKTCGNPEQIPLFWLHLQH